MDRKTIYNPSCLEDIQCRATFSDEKFYDLALQIMLSVKDPVERARLLYELKIQNILRGRIKQHIIKYIQNLTKNTATKINIQVTKNLLKNIFGNNNSTESDHK